MGLFKPVQSGGPAAAGGMPYPQAPTPPVAQPYVPPQQPYTPPQPQQPYVPQQPVMPQQPVTRLPQPPLPAPPSLGVPVPPTAYPPQPAVAPTQPPVYPAQPAAYPAQPQMPPNQPPAYAPQPTMPPAQPVQAATPPPQSVAPSLPTATARPVTPQAPVQPTPPPTVAVAPSQSVPRRQSPQAPTPPPQPVQPVRTQRARPTPTPPPESPARPGQPAASAPPPTPAREVVKPVAPKSAPQQPAKAAPQPVPPPQPKAPSKPVRPQRVVWEFPEPHPRADALMAMRNAPAVDPGGRIFLHVDDRLVALVIVADRPTVCWEYVTGCRTPGPVVVAPDGSIRLHASDGCLHCLSESGRQAWPPAHLGEPLGYAAPVVDAQGNTWISAFDGGLHKIDAEGRIHKPAPFFRSRQKLNAGGVIHQRVLYIGSEDGYVFAVQLDGERGQNLWNHAGGHGETGWYVHSTPAISEEGMLVVAGCDENLYGFRLDGTPAWRTQMPGQLLGSPVLDRFGHIYVGVSQSQRGQPPRGLLVCVDGNSHKIRWEYKAAGHVESTAVIGDDDLIYFGDNAGVIHAVDFRGAPRWTVQLDSPVRSAGTILAPQRLAFGLDSETLVVLNCSSQRLADSGWPKIGRTLGQCGMA